VSQGFARPTSGPCHPWGVSATLAWGLAALIAWLAVQILIGDVAGAWIAAGTASETVETLATHAPFVATVTIGSAIVPLAVIGLAVRLSACPLSDYLGLSPPPGRYWLIGLGALATLIPLVDLISWLAGYAVTPTFVLDLYRSTRDTGSLLFLLLAISVAAPLVEEIVFRGFLLPGLAASVLGTSGALILTSGAWALLHWQYHPFYLMQIILLGVVFGWLRLRSGSTALTIVLHGLLNFAALLQAAIVVEGRG
jgi:membrane protease YdiL (CAAX protease family)